MLVGRLSPRWSSPGLTPFLGRPGHCGYFCTTPVGGRLTPTYDLARSRSNTQRIFSGFKPGTFRPRSLTTKPPGLLNLVDKSFEHFHVKANSSEDTPIGPSV
ncbi:hypothetical protein AVEN_103563-1 [Araneus ventricosus]|uniref:Uncharacterized protein n=1 Tax=Araneus ventricosus TaxID=182803 RepID=A0A4Y2G6Z9_ARAVE|nr:hypothetical protein AVEN_103563-1 [Araneus ventricosus]